MPFNNIYYKRAVATAKSCYVCYRTTTTVLATINTTDFLYTCPGHLTDVNFATRIPEENSTSRKASSPAVSAEEIAKIKQEWEEKQKRKQEKEKEKEKAKEDDKEKDKEKKDQEKSKEGSPLLKPSPSSSSTSSPTPTHERYSLHRDFFAMRQLEHKKRRQVAQAKELAPRLPGVPLGSISPPAEQKY